MVIRSKAYQEAAKLIDKGNAYAPEDAIELAKKMAHVKFDETLEMHLRMGVDPRNANQLVRGIALLPHGLGKKVRILVFAQGEAEKIAKEAGADNVGGDELVKKIEGGWSEFDTAIATPDMMPKVGKLGKILGRKGLMPNPKSGTVVVAEDLKKVIEDAGKGRVEFRLDRTAIIHVTFCKASFEKEKLVENFTSLVEAIVKAKPAGVKGQYIRSAFIATTMGPSIKLDLKHILALAAG